MDSCGFVHTVTIGDTVSLNDQANLFLLNLELGGRVWHYATGLENDYEVKVIPASAKTGENINDLFEFVVENLTQQFRK